ncbi:MAG: vanadium-dependent haloperoxidase [Saprospiraceae bacterium]|nr:vanadium-dependent haloperoxidase [Saprospiraceae bacterium]
MKKLLYFLPIFVLLSCENSNPNFQKDAADAEFVHRTMKKITDVIVHDIFSPPVASRIYAYTSIAGYEASLNNEKYQTLAGQLTDFKPMPKPTANQEICHPLASVHAMLIVGKTMIFSEDKITEFEAEIYAEFQEIGIPKAVFEHSMAYGETVAKHVLAWASEDNYKQTRTFPKFEVNLDDEARWQPTPPDYMEGIEPSWNKIRPLAIDSAQQFQPPFPTEYSLDKNSLFYKELMEVYNVRKNLTVEQTEIAKFWDCNPFVSTHKAHLMYATKKITPGGHWINIVSIAARKSNSDFMQTLEAYTMTSIALMDGFISCWDEKYRSNLVRPETVINKNIDEDWLPLLQTPPFPEYTSGHSVISSAASVALTSIYGDNYAFEDTSEEEYGLTVRSFKSFYDASAEAAVSRLYGGIHYRPAIDNGVTQGKALGHFVVQKVKLK